MEGIESVGLWVSKRGYEQVRGDMGESGGKEGRVRADLVECPDEGLRAREHVREQLRILPVQCEHRVHEVDVRLRAHTYTL